MYSMSSLKHWLAIVVAGLATSWFAQHIDKPIYEDGSDRYETSIYHTFVSSGDWVVDPVADWPDYINMAIPTFDDPREWSLVYQLQNDWLSEWFYRYRKNAFIQVKVKNKGDKTRIVVKFFQLTNQRSLMNAIPHDKVVLDQCGKMLFNNRYANDQVANYDDFFFSAILEYMGDNRKDVPIQ